MNTSLSGLVVIRDSDEDGFLITESAILNAESRFKIACLLFDCTRLRGHRQHVLGVLADYGRLAFERLDPLFDRAIAAVPSPAPFERAARRQALIAAASRSGFADPAAVGAEFDRWAAGDGQEPASLYGHSPVSWLEGVLLGGAKFVATPEQSAVLREVLKPEAFDSSAKFAAPLFDVGQLGWDDVVDLRRNPRLIAFRNFVTNRLPGDAAPERIKNEMLEAYERLMDDVRPRSDAHIAGRLIGQAPFWVLPVNPLGVARDIFGAVKEHRMMRQHGHLIFVHEVKNKIAHHAEKPGLLQETGRRLRAATDYVLGG